MDMAGNVWEWSIDGNYSYDKPQAFENPVNVTQTWGKIIRGGAWDFNGFRIRTYYRAVAYYEIGSETVESYGFRCVMAP
jgi:formylglycine-generating enzyme required for sulfatase activity